MEDENELIEQKKCSFWDYFPARYFLTMMLFLGFFFVFSVRIGTSIALVAMINNTAIQHKYECADTKWGNKSRHKFGSEGEFNWDPYWQGLVLASFYFGYVLTSLLGAWLSDKYGSKWVFGGGVLSSSLFAFLIPVSARSGIDVFILVRFLQGVGEGVMYPSVFTICASWTTAKERSLVLAITLMGANVALVISTPISAVLCESEFLEGWPSVFYVFGTMGCLWFIAWSLLIFNNPESHPWMSNLERLHLNKNNQTNLNRTMPPIPWREIFTSIPFWALMYTRFTNLWTLYTMTSQLPSYLSSVLRLTLRENGMANALIFAFLCFGMGVSGYLSNYFRRYNYFSVNSIRKGFETTGLIGSAACLIFIPRAECNVALVIALMAIGQGLYGFNAGGSTKAIVDIAPKYAGVIAGLVGTISCTAGFLGPTLTGTITEEGQTFDEWNTVFYIMAGMLITGGLCFLSFGTAKVQSWAELHRRVCEPSPTETESSTTRNTNVMNNVATFESAPNLGTTEENVK